ncbi:hypothetical protein KC19_VG271700 [Ceratodon purpureus]|uniref:Uncharacterized protein n=1 Tax=Ceratodon purpureus TaxID=3225 RepID=A0A8T0HU50_CERPU|nr:hypothetical protein KC19_VG271700 [Ceratodon purpureus]
MHIARGRSLRAQYPGRRYIRHIDTDNTSLHKSMRILYLQRQRFSTITGVSIMQHLQKLVTLSRPISEILDITLRCKFLEPLCVAPLCSVSTYFVLTKTILPVSPEPHLYHDQQSIVPYRFQ